MTQIEVKALFDRWVKNVPEAVTQLTALVPKERMIAASDVYWVQLEGIGPNLVFGVGPIGEPHSLGVGTKVARFEAPPGNARYLAALIACSGVAWLQLHGIDKQFSIIVSDGINTVSFNSGKERDDVHYIRGKIVSPQEGHA